MAYVMNCLDTVVSTQAHGKWFTFKPKEIKFFHTPEIARFMGQMRGEEGLVEIPDMIAELKLSEDPKQQTEYKEYIEGKRKEGINARIKKLEWQRHNLLTSLKFDIEAKGLKMDPLILATKGDLSAIKELNQLTGEVTRVGESVAEQVRKELGLEPSGNVNSTNTGTANSGFTNPAKSTKA